MELKVLNISGKETGNAIKLSDKVFKAKPNDHAIYLDVKRIQAANHTGNHKAKERGEITGSTRKIKKQNSVMKKYQRCLRIIYKNKKCEERVYSKLKLEYGKGISFPTSISVNNMVGYYSPLEDNDIIKKGDIVKVEMGCHIDGFPACVVYTVVVDKVNL